MQAKIKSVALLFSFIFGLCAPGPVYGQAEEPSPRADSRAANVGGSPFSINLAIDLPIIGAAGSIALGSELAKGGLSGPTCDSACVPASVNSLDRTVIGNRSAAARTASDVLLGANIGMPFALDFLDVLVNRPADRFRGFGQDALVLAEVFAVNIGINNIVKFAVRRPRPFVYDREADLADRTSPDAALSFYSGHSSSSFAMATAYSYLFMLRHPGSKLIVPVWILFESSAAITAYLRVYAGMHFYTDVLTGALIGTSLGLLIPYLHRRLISEGARQKLAGLHLSATPLLFHDGGGILISAY